MGIVIVTDSATDLLPEEARELGVELIPLQVRFGEEEFEDGLTISRDEFYNRLIESEELPKTSQITPYRYGNIFRKAVEEGNEVVCLVMSSGISGCYQSAVLAASEFEGRVHVIDTQHFCGSEQLLVKRAVTLRNQGADAETIVKTIEKEKQEVRIIALFDTLEYCRLGGRISAAAAFAGSVLSIKPVVSIGGGVVQILGKARGSKNGNNLLVKFIREQGGIDWSRPTLLSWAGLDDKVMWKYVTDSSALYEGHSVDEIGRSRVGACIGTYSGPGAFAFSFFPNSK